MIGSAFIIEFFAFVLAISFVSFRIRLVRLVLSVFIPANVFSIASFLASALLTRIFIGLRRFCCGLCLINGLNLHCHFIVFSFGLINFQSHIFELRFIHKVLLIDFLNAMLIDEIAN